MDIKRLCGRCGAELVGVGAAQLCPGCLLEGGLETAPAPLTAENDGLDSACPPSGNGQLGDRKAEMPGRRHFGDYELLEEIARGGMGIIYKARQRSLGRIVALKMLLFGQSAPPDYVQRFRAEAAAAASLQHPHIVAIHEVGYREGQHFLAMEYVAGRSLAEMLRDGPLPYSRAAGYVKTIAKAVQYSHEHNILHRDLKPSNVLIDEFDQPKVTDFGLAKRLEKETELTLSGQVLGSPNYMSPEQAAPHRGLVGKRSDVYSLGALLYHLLTGRAPFAAPTVAETLHLVHHAEPLPPRILDPHLPPDLETICLKCLDKEPARRYPSAQELADELGRFLDDKPILARPAGRAEKLWRWCRRNPAAAALSVAAVLLFILGFAGVTWQWQRAEKNAAERQKAASEAQVQRDVARGRLYAAQMKLAHAAYKEGKLGAALELLEAQTPLPGQTDFRGFDWRYLYRLCSYGRGEILATNSSGIQSVDFAPDGRTVALGAGDGTVEIFDLQSRQRVARWQAHGGPVAGLAFCPRDPNSLATVSGDDGLLKLWDIAGKRVVYSTDTIRGIYAFVKVAFSPSGKFLVANAPGGPSLNLWEVRTSSRDGNATLVLRKTLPFRGPAAFSPDERTMAVCNEQPFEFKVALYDLLDDTVVSLGTAHSEGIQSVAFSWDGTMLATGGSDERLVLWDLKHRGTHRDLQVHLILANSVVFAPDNQTILCGGWDQNIHSYDLKKPGLPRIIGGHSAGINALAVLPRGPLLASVSQDGTARLWSLESGNTVAVSQPNPEFSTLLRSADILPASSMDRGIYAAAVSPDQYRVVAAVPDRLILYDLKTNAELCSATAAGVIPGEEFRSVTFSPDGRQLAVGGDGGTAAILDANTLQRLREPLALHGGQISDIAYGSGGAVLATGGGFGTGIALTDTASGRIMRTFGAVEGYYPMQPLAISPDGKQLATGSPDQSIRLWDVASGRLLATCPQKARFPFCMKFSPDGKLLAFADTFRFLYLWDHSGRRPVRRLSGHTGAVIALAFSPDGTLASGGMDHSIRLWHPEVDQEVAILDGHSGWVWCVAFAENGDTLVSGSGDGTLKLWRALPFRNIEAGADATRPKR